MTSFSIFNNIEKKIQENLGKVLNTPFLSAPFSIIFSITLCFNGVKTRCYGVKG